MVDKVNATIGNMANVKSQNFVKGLTEKVGMNWRSFDAPEPELWTLSRLPPERLTTTRAPFDPATGVMTVTNKEAFDALNNSDTQAEPAPVGGGQQPGVDLQ